jgi:hypothetical protein
MTNQESTGTARAVPVGQPDAVKDRAMAIEKARSHRKTYLTFFVLSLAAFIAAVILRATISSLSVNTPSSHAIKNLSVFFVVALALELVFLVCFIVTFLRAAREVHCYSTGKLILYLVLLLIPIVSLIVLVVLDHSMYLESLGEEERPTAEHPHFSELAIWSLSVVLFPVLGLPLAIVALHKLDRSGGKLKGRNLAITSIALNAAVLGLFIGLLSSTPHRNEAPRPIHARRTHLTRPGPQ